MAMVTLTNDEANIVQAFLDAFPNEWRGAVNEVRSQGYLDAEIVTTLSKISVATGGDPFDPFDLPARNDDLDA